MGHKLLLLLFLVKYTLAVENRVINGFTPGRFDNPHVVFLFINYAQSTGFCSGSLLNPFWVLTAGHCGAGATSMQVSLGLYNRTEGAIQVIIVPATSIFVHPNFVNNGLAFNDLCLLRLNPAANTAFTQIRPIPIACASSGTFANRAGRLCGWGLTNPNAADVPIVLQCVDMTIITNNECLRDWPIRTTNICTRIVNLRAGCHGDSGGPLVALDGPLQRQKLVGAVSFGSNGCNQNIPNVFSRVASFQNWITSVSGVFCNPL